MLHTKLICGVCGANLMLFDDIYICPECGFEADALPIKPDGVKYDGYWTREDERRINEELDDYFYIHYPQFRKK